MGVILSAEATEWREQMRAAAERGNVARLSALLAETPEGESVNSDLGNGRTGLHWASWQGNLAACEFLLQYGADADARDANGNSPRCFCHSAFDKPADLVREAAQLFDAYAGPTDASRIPAEQRFKVEVDTRSAGAATRPLLDAFAQRVNSVAAERLGFGAYWYTDRDGGIIYVTAGETETLRTVFEEVCGQYDGDFSVTLTGRAEYDPSGRANGRG